MCNRYQSPAIRDIKLQWQVQDEVSWDGGGVYPRSPGVFLRASMNGSFVAVVGRWGLIPSFAKTSAIRYNTNNARSEELSQKASYRDAWARGSGAMHMAASKANAWRALPSFKVA